MLGFQTYGTPAGEGGTTNTLVAIGEVCCVQLQTRFCGVALQRTTALGIGDSGSEAQGTLFFLVQYVVMVKAFAELNLLVIGINVFAKSLRRAEVEGSASYLQNFSGRYSRLVGGQIEVGIDFAQLVVDAWSGVGNTCE